MERCSAGPYILLRKERDGSLYISSTFTDLSGLQAKPLPSCEDCYHSYLPQFSDPQCNLLQRHHPKYGSDWLTLADPASLEVTLSTKDVFKLIGITYRNVVWVVDSQERILALMSFGAKGGAITLIDLHNGVEADLIESGGEREQTYILAWMPP